MRWYHSIITKVSAIFILAFLGMGAVFYALLEYEKNKDLMQMLEYSRIALHGAFDGKTRSLDFEKLSEMGFVLVEDSALKEKILSLKHSGQRPLPPPKPHMEERMRFGVDVIADGTAIYTILQRRDTEPLILKTPYKKELFPRMVFVLLLFGMLIAFYISIIRSLLPLRTLQHHIKALADGNYDITCYSHKKDEIAVLANEFDTTVKKMKALRDARQLFLRNIMHEIKTPITKGKLAVEMIDEGKYTAILRNVFRRQEALLEEFSRIEKLSADELKLDIQPYRIQDVVDFALDILEDRRENIHLSITPISVHVDFELFGVALKNLLDNGLNYALDHAVSLSNDAQTITISNKGSMLEFPLERYAEPYFLEGKKQKSSRGLGFGLFITWHIIRLHGMKISYTHHDGINAFVITL